MTDPQPQHLYKFREFSELHISSVASNKIWLAAPDALNDRQDINLIDIVADVPNERIRREIQGISDDIRAKSGIYSLSAAPLSHEMWTMYASKGRGFCIEYDTTNCDQNRSHLLPVTYSDEKRCYQTIEDLLVQNWPPKDSDAIKGILQYFFCRKSLYWKFEEEFRLFSNKPFTSKTDKGRLSPIPFSVSSIILGPFANSQDALKLRSEFESNGLPTPAMKKIVQDKETGDYSILTE